MMGYLVMESPLGDKAVDCIRKEPLLPGLPWSRIVWLNKRSVDMFRRKETAQRLADQCRELGEVVQVVEIDMVWHEDGHSD